VHMMRVVPFVGVTVLACIVPSPTATAGAPSCRIVSDRLNDAGLVSDPTGRGLDPITQAELPDPSLDIRSADIATTPSYVTIVIRLAAFTAIDPQSPVGRSYMFSARVTRIAPRLFARLSTGALDVARAEWGFVDDMLGPLAFGPARAVVDSIAGEVRMSILLDAAPGLQPRLGRAGVVFDQLQVETSRVVGDPAGSRDPTGYGTIPMRVAADRADSTAKYLGGSPSCVRIGR
jgi:hypothetical protein